MVAPFEGRYRYIGYDVIYAVRLALQEVNAAGGVGGYNVELVAYDDGADPVMAVEQARKLATDPQVVAVIGHFREETTLAASDIYAEAGIPLVAPDVFAPMLTEGDVYRLAPSAKVVASALLEYLDELEHDQVALVTNDGSLGVALQQIAQSYQVQVWPVASLDQANWLESVMVSGVEVVLCDADPVTAGETISALRTMNWEGLFLGGPELAVSDFVAVSKDVAAGAVFVTPWPFPDDETVFFDKNIVSAYQAISNGVPPGPLALPAYEATWILLEVLGQDIVIYRKPTRNGMAIAFPTTEREGELGPITFDTDGNWNEASLYWYRYDAKGVVRSLGKD
ncbi:MAG: ABC transporter substrate-binding protein [Chloroflexi bacterium]|nr:ABC transporter substrate-binding protein [Chloroflexota bacterium]